MSGGDSTLIGAPLARDLAQAVDTDKAVDPGGNAADSRDLQSLLADALRRLAESTGSSRACAWARRPDGSPYVIAATYRDATSPQSPDAAAFEALEPLFAIKRPIDLGASLVGIFDDTSIHDVSSASTDAEAKSASMSSVLSQLAVNYGMSCAMPLHSANDEAVAIVLLGSTDDPPGNVRPRTLAALDAAVTRLRAPTAAAGALARLSHLDAEVCRLDRLAVLGDLLAEVAHEIRNPLVSMKTFLQLLPEHQDDKEFQVEFRGVVLEELQRMERLLDTLLEHARPVSNRVASESPHSAANLERVFGSLLRLLEQRAAERGVELRVEVEVVADDIAIGEDTLRQILLNLVLNALEAAPRSSAVTLRAELFETSVSFSVEDEGDGVPENMRARLFEPFFSTREGRAGGLGLAITKKLIEEAGGAIRIESAGAGGAKFCVDLPRLASLR